MSPQLETVGERIRTRRLALGLTQEALAAACDVSRSAVAQWETDRSGQLRDNITRIANALGTTVGALLHGERPDAEFTGDELAMVRLYRECCAEDRAFLLRTARRLAMPAGVQPGSPRKPRGG